MTLERQRELNDATGDWWKDVDEALLGCLSENGPMSPDDLGRRLGMSPPAVVSLLCLLAQDGRVRITLVEDGHAHTDDVRAA